MTNGSHASSVPDAKDTVYCELCALSHQPGATSCDACDHLLGTTPDWDALRRELSTLRNKAWLGAALIVAMLAANAWLFGGGGVVVVFAPFAWVLHSVYRHRLLSRRLGNREG